MRHKSNRLIINCGASSITAADVCVEDSQLRINKVYAEDLQYDYSVESSWLEAFTVGLKTLTTRHKLSGAATVIIPGDQLLIKTIRIPHVAEQKRKQIIAFEAQQSIPYALDEVVWDSQVVGDDGIETEVLFIACKANTIYDLCDRISASGLQVEAVSAATILDYNSLQYTEDGLNQDLLSVNIGARSTNLLFSNANGFFARNIALGGNTLTQSISDGLGINFTQAEALKLKLLESDCSDADDATTKLLKDCTDAFVLRMRQEITRSIVNYRRQKNAPAPSTILLNGGASQLRSLGVQLEAMQQVNVRHYEPLKSFDIGPEVIKSAEGFVPKVSEIIGEAVSTIIAKPAQVNLLPEVVEAKIRFAAKKPFLLAAAFCLAMAPWPVAMSYKKATAAYVQQAERFNSAAAPLSANKSALNELSESAKRLQGDIRRVEGLIQSKGNWIQFCAELQLSLTEVEDVWLDELSVVRTQPGVQSPAGDSSYSITLSGEMLVRESIDAGAGGVDRALLTRRIKQLQSSFSASKFVIEAKQPVIRWTKLNNGLNVLPFLVNLSVDTTKPL
ncbi:MAG: pilus assembly protein PilM [Verrucomicrobiota bacterium]|nr:pilus assembly protein PilM [Verrucomicrobiota bacterium]